MRRLMSLVVFLSLFASAFLPLGSASPSTTLVTSATSGHATLAMSAGPFDQCTGGLESGC
ncbi:MAG: hypothetical protein ACRDHP_14205 [Ktedonobacterales bacterium]